MLFLKCSAEVYYGLHYCSKLEILTHYAGLLIHMVTRLERSHLLN